MWYNANLFFCLRSFHSFVLSFHLRTREMLKWWLFSNEYVFLFRTQKCVNLMVWGRIQRWKNNGNEQNYIAKKYCVEGKKWTKTRESLISECFFLSFLVREHLFIVFCCETIGSAREFIYMYMYCIHNFRSFRFIFLFLYIAILVRFTSKDQRWHQHQRNLEEGKATRWMCCFFLFNVLNEHSRKVQAIVLWKSLTLWNRLFHCLRSTSHMMNLDRALLRLLANAFNHIMYAMLMTVFELCMWVCVSVSPVNLLRI